MTKTAATKPAEQAPPPADQPATSLAMVKNGVVDVVGERVNAMAATGELHLPENYSAPNALKSAWLALQETKDKNGKPVLQACSQNSIANALLDMVVQGLNPGKDQCYFIAYGSTLTCQRSYFGDVALLRRIYGQDTEVYPEVVYEGDEVAYSIERGRKTITKHVQEVANINPEKIVAAYCVVERTGHEPYTEVMTIDQIKRSWEQGQTKGKSPAHTGFPDQMCKRTVTRRATKVLINGSDDSVLQAAIERSDLSAAEAELAEEAAERANAELIDFSEPKALPAEPATMEAPAPAEPEKAEAEPRASKEAGGPGF